MAKKYKITKSVTIEGKRYFVHGDTEAEVAAKLALKIRDVEEGRVVSGSMSVANWTKRCLDVYKPNVSERYRKEMELRIGKHILAEIGDLPLKSVKPLQCQEILNNQIGMSKSHITKLHQEMLFIFDKAVANQLILKNPAVECVKPSGTKGQRRSLTETERRHLLAVCEDDDRFVFFLLMLFCGCRPGEAMEAEGRDISILDGIPTLHIRGTKTENADRIVPIPADLYARVKDAEPFQKLAANSAGHKHTASSYKRLVNALKRALNISMGARVYRNKIVPPYPLAADFTPYMLRHTYCTDLQKNGVDVRAAQKLMGHADIRTTANIYTHQDNETFIQAADAMGIRRIV